MQAKGLSQQSHEPSIAMEDDLAISKLDRWGLVTEYRVLGGWNKLIKLTLTLMAKSSEMFLKVPQGPPGAPVAENKLLWKRRATLAGEMQEQKKSC